MVRPPSGRGVDCDDPDQDPRPLHATLLRLSSDGGNRRTAAAGGNRRRRRSYDIDRDPARARHPRRTRGPLVRDYEAVSIGFSHPFLGSAFTFVTLGWTSAASSPSPTRTSLPATPLPAILRRRPVHLPAGLRRRLGRQGVPAGQVHRRHRADGPARVPISDLGDRRGVLFVDAGQVRDDFSAFTPDGFHFTGGAGIRFAFSDTSILAFDLGFTGEPCRKRGTPRIPLQQRILMRGAGVTAPRGQAARTLHFSVLPGKEA